VAKDRELYLRFISRARVMALNKSGQKFEARFRPLTIFTAPMINVAR
jgi:hypothetical protein